MVVGFGSSCRNVGVGWLTAWGGAVGVARWKAGLDDCDQGCPWFALGLLGMLGKRYVSGAGAVTAAFGSCLAAGADCGVIRGVPDAGVWATAAGGVQGLEGSTREAMPGVVGPR